MSDNYEKLNKAIELLNSHKVMVISIILAERHDRFNQVIPARYLNKEERESLTEAMELLLEIRNNERKREQDEHAIAFAKLHKDSEDPTTRRLSRDILDKAGELPEDFLKNMKKKVKK